MKLYLAAMLFQVLNIVLALAQAQAPAPGPAGPTNITAVLSKAGQFTMFMRLLDTTQETTQINSELNNSKSQGLTILAPTDNAFSSLKSGMMNSLSDEQKVQLVQFHILPTYLSLSNFQTASNPLRTQAGNSENGQFPINVTTAGNQVNITTGVVNTTVSNSLYSDGQLAVYQVDQVLLPLAFFTTPAPAPSPVAAAAKPKKGAKSGDTTDTDTDTNSAPTQLISHINIASKLAFFVAPFIIL